MKGFYILPGGGDQTTKASSHGDPTHRTTERLHQEGQS